MTDSIPTSKAVKQHRTYVAKLRHARYNDDTSITGDMWATHHTAVNTTIARIQRQLLAVVATAVNGEWVDRYLAADSLKERVRLATVIAGSWVAPVDEDADENLFPLLGEGTVDDAAQVVRQHLAVLGYDQDTSDALLRDAAPLLARREPPENAAPTGRFARRDTRWVSLLPLAGMEPSDIGWGTGNTDLRARLTGTPDGAKTGDLNILTSGLLSYALGASVVDSPVAEYELGRDLAAALNNPNNTSVADVAATFGVAAEALKDRLWVGKRKAKEPAMMTPLTNYGLDTPLDDAVLANGTTYREVWLKGANGYADRWEVKAQEAERVEKGEQLAGAWLWDVAIAPVFGDTSIRKGNGGAFADMLLSAASAIATARAKQFSRAAEWGTAAAELADTEQQFGAHPAVTAVEVWLNSKPWPERAPGGAPVLPLGGDRFLYPKIATAWRDTDAATVDRLMKIADDMGATWTDFYKMLAEHPPTWDTEDAVTAVTSVAHARSTALRLRPITCVTPSAITTGPGITFSSGSGWGGKLDRNGRITLSIWDGAAIRTVNASWSSRRLKQVLFLDRAAAAGARTMVAIVRGGDKRALLKPEVAEAGGVEHTYVDATLVNKASMVLQLVPQDDGTLTPTLAVSLPHNTTAPIFNDGAPLRVLGVHISADRDATWALWERVPESCVDGTVTTTSQSGRKRHRGWGIATYDGRTRKAAAVGPTSWAAALTTGTCTTYALESHRARIPVRFNVAQAIEGFNDALQELTGGPVDASKGQRTAFFVAVKRFRTALKTQNQFAHAIDNPDTGVLPQKHWPVDPDDPNYSPVDLWVQRDAMLHAAAEQLTLMLGQRLFGKSRPTPHSVTQLRDLRACLQAYGRRTIPNQAQHRQLATPSVITGTVLDAISQRSADVADMWAGRLAAELVAVALTHGANVIALPAQDALAYDSSALAKRYTSLTYGQLVKRLTDTATLHGIDVIDDTMPGSTAREHPLTGQIGARVAAMSLPDAVQHSTKPQWQRVVARAAATTTDTADPHDPFALEARLITEVNEKLKAAAVERRNSGNEDAWDHDHRATEVLIPVSYGGMLYSSDNPDSITVQNTADGGWTFTGHRGDRRTLGADQIAQAGARRKIKQN